MRGFSSGVADQVSAFVRHREAAGAICDSYRECLHLFDAHCAERFPGERAVTQEMVDTWCARRPAELAKSCRSRCYAVVSLVRFLRQRGLTDARDPELPREREPPAPPHAFTDDELAAFLAACDSWRPTCNMPRTRALRTKWTLPVLYRLLWSSGIRTTEARLLRRGNVDLAGGVLSIVEGKGRNERLVALHPSMAAIMREYDARIDGLMPGRAYFFPNGHDTPLARDWVAKYFRTLWARVSDERATPYMLRHAYAIENINALVGRGVDGLDGLELLSRSMGHTSVDVTAQGYYSLVPSLAGLMQRVSGPGFDDVVPEAL